MEMEMIDTPREVGVYLVRAPHSSASAEKKVVRADVISEPGILRYGVEDSVEREVGWLVRTNGTESNEGGVVLLLGPEHGPNRCQTFLVS
jgi:glutathione synthase